MMKKLFLLLGILSISMILLVTVEASEMPKSFQELHNSNGNYVMPSEGQVRGLVIPMLFEERSEEYTSQMIETLNNLFNNRNAYNNLSVSQFYDKSSRGKLNLSFEIYNPFQLSRSYLDYERTVLNRGSSLMVQEFLNATELDLADFDANNNGYVDALYIIYDRAFERDHPFWEAFTKEYAFSQNSPTKINNFVFMSYQFFIEYGASYAIRETGRLLGVNAFERLRGEDIMDGLYGDHNPLNKLLLGWVEPIVCYRSCDLNLKSFQDGDLILVTDKQNFNINYDLFSEFILIDYFDVNAPLNSFRRNPDIGFEKSGIRLQRANITLYGNARDGFHFNNQLVELISRNLNVNLLDLTNNQDLFVAGDLIRPEEYTQLLSSTKLDLGFNIEIRAYEPNSHFHVLVHFVNESPYAPRIEGVEDFEIRMNDRIDFLAGIKAFDHQGRPIEELFLTGTFPVNIPGTYRMGVIAYDEDGNKAVSHFMVTVTTSANFRNVYLTLVVCLAILGTVGLFSFAFSRYRKENQ
ncbi:MAG: hypothetical protein FWE36_03965 [Erysipelotrichales bacterium]|nr:hypothetical protein [Erysipelotrichales bacterium]